LRFLVKSLIVLIFLIFALPLFIHHLDSQEWEKMEELARAKKERAVSMTARVIMICDKLITTCISSVALLKNFVIFCEHL